MIRLLVGPLTLILTLLCLVPPVWAQDAQHAQIAASLNRIEAALSRPAASASHAPAAVVQDMMGQALQMQAAAFQYRMIAQMFDSLSPQPKASGPLGIFSAGGSTVGALAEWAILLAAFAHFGVLELSAGVVF